MTEKLTVLGPFFCRNSLLTSALIIGCFQIIFIIINFFSAILSSAWLSSYYRLFNGSPDVILDAIMTVLWSFSTMSLFFGLVYRKRPFLFLPTLVVQSIQIFVSLCNVALMIYLFAVYPTIRRFTLTAEQFAVERRITYSIYGIKLFMNATIIGFAIVCFRLIFICHTNSTLITPIKNPKAQTNGICNEPNGTCHEPNSEKTV